MIYLIVLYFIFSILLILKNHRNHIIIWYTLMLIGFLFSTFGLALYTTYILGSTYSDNVLFHQVENLLLKLNYYLDLDITQQFRVMNIGMAIYIYSAICYAVSFTRKRRLAIYVLLSLGPLCLLLLYDPSSLQRLYGLDMYSIYEVSIQSISDTMSHVNIIFNLMIKLYLISAIVIMIHTYLKTPRILRKKYMYTMFGIIPLWALFVLLFFYFPNHNIIYRRYEQLYMYNFTYNPYIYHTVTYLSILSFVLLLFATFKYNVFDSLERKKQISFNQQFETANIGLRVFTHAIKNQFVAIKLLSENLDHMEDLNQEQIREMTREITRVCNGAIGKLSDLNQSTKKIKLNYDYLNVNLLINECVKTMNKDYIATNATCDLRLYIDGEQFNRVMENLIINSIEAVKDIEHPRITIHLRQSPDYGIIEIQDNGCGIGEKALRKVTKPFYTTKPTMSNWGVGLSFCRRAIDAFGGELDIQSKEQQGTSITIYLPKERRN